MQAQSVNGKAHSHEGAGRRPVPTRVESTIRAMDETFPAGEARIGRYRVVRRLATGGMAEVWLCELPSEAGLGKRVVLKRLVPHLRQEPELVRMFLDEARITMPLQHSNIAATIELAREADDYYIVTEHVDGPDLGRVLEHVAGPLEIPACLAITAAVLEALAYAHEARDDEGRPLGIVHRDVSPGNILLSRQGDIKLADFGVARAAHRLRRTIDGVVRGTLPYMSPEQAAGEAVDARSDLYGLGAVLWRMASGREIPGVTRGYGNPPLQRLGLPDPAERILERALHPSPEGRFATAGAMLAEVRATRAELAADLDPRAVVVALVRGFAPPAPATRDSPAPRTAPTVVLRPHHRRWPAVAAAGAIALALALWFTIGAPPRAGEMERPPIAPASSPQPEEIPPPVVEEPRPTPAPPAPRAESRVARGRLDLLASPWAYVEIDGRRLPGHTPKRDVSVAPGTHRIRFVNPELGRSQEVKVTVRPSAVERVHVDLEAP